MFHKKSPFDKANLKTIEKMIKSQTFYFNPGLDRRLKNLILMTMRLNPDHRPSIDQILNEKDFRDILRENQVSVEALDKKGDGGLIKNRVVKYFFYSETLGLWIYKNLGLVKRNFFYKSFNSLIYL